MIFTDEEMQCIKETLRVRKGMILHSLTSSFPEHIEYRGRAGEKIPFSDRNGNELHVGDIVEVFDEWGKTKGFRRMVKLENDDKKCEELNLRYPTAKYPVYYPTSFLHNFINDISLTTIIRCRIGIGYGVVLRQKYYDTYTTQEIDRIGFIDLNKSVGGVENEKN